MRESSFLSSFCIRVNYPPLLHPTKKKRILSCHTGQKKKKQQKTGIQHPRGIQQFYN